MGEFEELQSLLKVAEELEHQQQPLDPRAAPTRIRIC